jgi:TRAP-type C4-dicarboxylate transport system substrate-binding protein
VPGGKVVLVLATVSSQIQERPAVEYFIRRVEALSGGNVSIHVLYNAGGAPNPDAEQAVVREVSASSLAQLAVVGTRVFDTMGVRSFQALGAPLLIDSYPLENKVVDSGIARQMLVGLAPLHVSGVGLLASGLRKPVAVKMPLLGQADWRGITFGIYLSQVEEEAVRALGARPLVAFSGLRSHFLAGGQLQGYEFALLSYNVNGAWSQAHYIAANVNLWPQVDVLIANPGTLAQLTSQQRGWIEQAAREATERSASLMASAERRVLPTICSKGTRLAYASRADLAWLRMAFAPLDSRLENDPQTKSFIARIQAIKRATPAGPGLAIPKGCVAKVASP